MLILTGLSNALCYKSRAGNIEIGNKRDYISCYDSKFHAIRRSSDNLWNLYIQVVLILTGLNNALCCRSRASYTEIGSKKYYISLRFPFNLSGLSIIIIQVVLILTGLNSVLCCRSRVSYTVTLYNINIIINIFLQGYFYLWWYIQAYAPSNKAEPCLLQNI